MNYRFDYRRYRLPFRSALWTSHGRWEAREGVMVCLEREDGFRTYGEACPIPRFGTETVEEVETRCGHLGKETNDEILDGVSAEELPCLSGALASARENVGPPKDESARAVAALLPAGRRAVELIESRAEVGFRTFKWKVGVGVVADELVLLDDVCARLPSGARLRLDANGAWDRRAAERWLDRCADYPVEYVEQPCFAAASEGTAQQDRMDDLLLGLASDYPTPLALDESVVHGREVTHWIEQGWPGYYVLKTSLLGDVSGALAALEKARAKVVFSSALETAIGAKSALRSAFGWGGTKHALGFGVWPLFEQWETNGPTAAPFIRWKDVTDISEEAAWNAMS